MLIKVKLQRKQAISITPLIDVVFILLLFFMLSSTFQRHTQIEMHASLPGHAVEQESQAHRLLLDIQNVIIVDGVKYAWDSLEFSQRLEQFAESNDKITLASAPNVKMQSVIQLLDRLHSAGIANLNLAKSEPS